MAASRRYRGRACGRSEAGALASVGPGKDDGTMDGRDHLLGALDAEADVAVAVADDDKGLEAGALAGARLLLHGGYLHHLVLEQEQLRRRAVLLLLRTERAGRRRRRDGAAGSGGWWLGLGFGRRLLVGWLGPEARLIKPPGRQSSGRLRPVVGCVFFRSEEK